MKLTDFERGMEAGRPLAKEQGRQEIIDWLRKHNSEGEDGKYLGLEPDDWKFLKEYGGGEIR